MQPGRELSLQAVFLSVSIWGRKLLDSLHDLSAQTFRRYGKTYNTWVSIANSIPHVHGEISLFERMYFLGHLDIGIRVYEDELATTNGGINTPKRSSAGDADLAEFMADIQTRNILVALSDSWVMNVYGIFRLLKNKYRTDTFFKSVHDRFKEFRIPMEKFELAGGRTGNSKKAQIGGNFHPPAKSMVWVIMKNNDPLMENGKLKVFIRRAEADRLLSELPIHLAENYANPTQA